MNNGKGKRISIVGSSGGALWSQGGNAPEELLSDIVKQATAAGFVVGPVIFIAASQSLDGNPKDTKAELIFAERLPQEHHEKQIADINISNERAKVADASLAQRIRAGEVDGLILISSDPQGVNHASVSAAAEAGIPVVSTGATSSAAVEHAGVQMILSGGSTGSTNLTRAVAYISAFSQYWKLPYRPELGDATPMGEFSWSRINLGGVLNACLPAFIVLSIASAVHRFFPDVFTVSIGEVFRLGVIWVVTVIAAYRISQSGESGLIVGGITGALVIHGRVEILGGLFGGILAGLFLLWAFRICNKWRLPPNVGSLLSIVVASVLSGVLILVTSPAFVFLDVHLWNIYQYVVSFRLPGLGIPLFGLVAGIIIWASIRSGFYHRIILPLILFEMSKEGVSLLGTIDLAGLVMVAAGIELANLIRPRQRGEKAVAKSVLVQSLGFGTYVEGAYVFMVDRKVRISATIIAGLSGLLANMLEVRGTAYVPVYLAPFLSNHPWEMALVLGFALGASFLVTLLLRFFDTK